MEQVKQAKLIKARLPGFRGDASLYQLIPALHDTLEKKDYEFVVVSAVSVLGEPETYIFGADEEGSIDTYSELEGSFRGGLNHAEALNNAGYQVQVPA